MIMASHLMKYKDKSKRDLIKGIENISGHMRLLGVYDSMDITSTGGVKICNNIGPEYELLGLCDVALVKNSLLFSTKSSVKLPEFSTKQIMPAGMIKVFDTMRCDLDIVTSLSEEVKLICTSVYGKVTLKSGVEKLELVQSNIDTLSVEDSGNPMTVIALKAGCRTIENVELASHNVCLSSYNYIIHSDEEMAKFLEYQCSDKYGYDSVYHSKAWSIYIDDNHMLPYPIRSLDLEPNIEVINYLKENGYIRSVFDKINSRFGKDIKLKKNITYIKES